MEIANDSPYTVSLSGFSLDLYARPPPAGGPQGTAWRQWAAAPFGSLVRAAALLCCMRIASGVVTEAALLIVLGSRTPGKNPK